MCGTHCDRIDICTFTEVEISASRMKLIFCSTSWATVPGSSPAANTQPSPSAELDPLLTYLTRTFGFLSRALAQAPLRRIARGVLPSISNILWDVLSHHRFSTAGAAQLSADLAAICQVLTKAVGQGVAEAGLRKCLEGAQLVGLPVKGSKSEVKPASADEAGGDDWDAWGAGDGDDDDIPKEHAVDEAVVTGEDLGLWEVEKRLFADNQSARDVLEELGMEMLSETEARAVLGRRVELAG